MRPNLSNDKNLCRSDTHKQAPQGWGGGQGQGQGQHWSRVVMAGAETFSTHFSKSLALNLPS